MKLTIRELESLIKEEVEKIIKENEVLSKEEFLELLSDERNMGNLAEAYIPGDNKYIEKNKDIIASVFREIFMRHVKESQETALAKNKTELYISISGIISELSREVARNKDERDQILKEFMHLMLGGDFVNNPIFISLTGNSIKEIMLEKGWDVKVMSLFPFVHVFLEFS